MRQKRYRCNDGKGMANSRMGRKMGGCKKIRIKEKRGGDRRGGHA